MIYGEAAAQLTAPFVLLMIKAGVNLPRVIFRSFLQKSQHPQNHRQMFVILSFISSLTQPSQKKIKIQHTFWPLEFRDRDEKRREDIPAHSHTLTARRETFNDAWGAPGQAQYVGKMLVLQGWLAESPTDLARGPGFQPGQCFPPGKTPGMLAGYRSSLLEKQSGNNLLVL